MTARRVFTSPTPDMALAVTQAVDGGAGVLYSYGRYQGDILNFDMAAELAGDEGIRSRPGRHTVPRR
jgi:dihydroxyacetone kinase-like protein